MSASHPTPASDAGRAGWLPVLQLSAQEVFGLMLGSTVEVPQESAMEPPTDVTAMVGLAGQVSGILTVRCSTNAAARIASLMLGVGADQAASQMWDAVGELCNMIAGNFKNKLGGVWDGCMLSVPTVITGADYSLHAMADEEICTVLLFEGEPLMLGLEVHR